MSCTVTAPAALPMRHEQRCGCESTTAVALDDEQQRRLALSRRLLSWETERLSEPADGECRRGSFWGVAPTVQRARLEGHRPDQRVDSG
jgi:hypothetical protein